MLEDKKILCGASQYEQLFYFNPEFDSLPKAIKDELKILCVLYTEDVGGILRLEFDEEGNLNLVTESKEDDYFFDEIGSVLKIKQIQQEKENCWRVLKCIIKYFFCSKSRNNCYTGGT